ASPVPAARTCGRIASGLPGGERFRPLPRQTQPLLQQALILFRETRTPLQIVEAIVGMGALVILADQRFKHRPARFAVGPDASPQTVHGKVNATIVSVHRIHLSSGSHHSQSSIDTCSQEGHWQKLLLQAAWTASRYSPRRKRASG